MFLYFYFFFFFFSPEGLKNKKKKIFHPTDERFEKIRSVGLFVDLTEKIEGWYKEIRIVWKKFFIRWMKDLKNKTVACFIAVG